MRSSDCRLYKADLSGRKSDYEKASIEWVVGWIQKHEDFLLKADVRGPFFGVNIWPEHGQPAHPGFHQEFHGRVVSKQDLKNARSYVADCLKQGAVLADIALWMFIPKEYDFKNVYIELWEME